MYTKTSKINRAENIRPRLLTNPVRRYRVCQIIQRLNLKQKGMRALRSAFRTNRGISPIAIGDLDSVPRPCDLLKKVDQNFYVFCQHKTFVSKLTGGEYPPEMFALQFLQKHGASRRADQSVSIRETPVTAPSSVYTRGTRLEIPHTISYPIVSARAAISSADIISSPSLPITVAVSPT